MAEVGGMPPHKIAQLPHDERVLCLIPALGLTGFIFHNPNRQGLLKTLK